MPALALAAPSPPPSPRSLLPLPDDDPEPPTLGRACPHCRPLARKRRHRHYGLCLFCPLAPALKLYRPPAECLTYGCDGGVLAPAVYCGVCVVTRRNYAAEPITAAPGSVAKLDALAARLRRCEQLFHPDDATGDPAPMADRLVPTVHEPKPPWELLGVERNKGCWRARPRVGGGRVNLGSFARRHDAETASAFFLGVKKLFAAADGAEAEGGVRS